MSVPGTGNGAENLVEEADENSRFMSNSRVNKEVVVVTFLGVYISTSQDSEEILTGGFGQLRPSS